MKRTITDMETFCQVEKVMTGKLSGDDAGNFTFSPRQRVFAPMRYLVPGYHSPEDIDHHISHDHGQAGRRGIDIDLGDPEDEE